MANAISTREPWLRETLGGLGYELVQPVFLLFAEAVPRDGSPKDSAWSMAFIALS